MKINVLFTILVVYIFSSCAYKPLYKRANLYYPHKVKIVIKSKEKYEKWIEQAAIEFSSAPDIKRINLAKK